MQSTCSNLLNLLQVFCKFRCESAFENRIRSLARSPTLAHYAQTDTQRWDSFAAWQLAARNRLHSIRLLPSIIYTYNYSCSSFAAQQQQRRLLSFSATPNAPPYPPATRCQQWSLIGLEWSAIACVVARWTKRSQTNVLGPGRPNYVCLAVSQIVAAALWQQRESEREGSSVSETCSLQLHNKSNLINWGQSARLSTSIGVVEHGRKSHINYEIVDCVAC